MLNLIISISKLNIGFHEQGERGIKRRVYMNEFRCPQCNKLLFKYKLKGSLKIEVKCTRCYGVANLVVESGETRWED